MFKKPARITTYALLALLFAIILFFPDQSTLSQIVSIESEPIPLDVPSVDNTYLSGYNIEWTAPLDTAGSWVGSVNGQPLAKLSFYGQSDTSFTFLGQTRSQVEAVLGGPLTHYNNTRIQALNSPSKGYYAYNNTLLLLYYDTESNAVLMGLELSASLAKDSRFFTSSELGVFELEDMEKMTAELVNAFRISNGKAPLLYDVKTALLSRNHSLSMMTAAYFSHDNPQGQGPKERLKASGIPYSNYGEALTAGTWTPMDALMTWVNSPPHRQILLGDYHTVGIGIANGPSPYGIYYTLLTVKSK